MGLRHASALGALRPALAFASVLAVLAPDSARATPSVFHSAPPPVDLGATSLPTDPASQTLELWFDAGEPYYDFLLSLVVGSGMTVVGFIPDPIAVSLFDLTTGDGGSLSLIGGDSLSEATGPTRLGELSIVVTAIGSELRVEPIHGVSAPSYVNGAFELVGLPTPLLAAVAVPEPGTGWLLALGLVTLGSRKSRCQIR